MSLSHRKDVEFLEECNPALVERNAAEFKRLRDLLVQAEEPARRAETGTQWQSDGSHTYTDRLSEARQLVLHMAEGYDKAASALHAYAAALTTAKSHYSNGKRTERKLAALIATKGTAITRTAQEAEPMRQWEDMRATTGVMDFFAELTMDVDDIRDEANRLHDDAGGSFHQAKTAEQEARSVCVHALKQAYELLPEFKVKSGRRRWRRGRRLRGDGRHPPRGGGGPYQPLTHLPGSGPKKEMTGPFGNEPVSPELRDIRMRVAGLPEADDNYWDPPQSDEGRAEWIRNNKEILRAAAQRAGLPEEMVAGIAWKEVGGQPGIFDDGVDFFRQAADAPWGLSPVTAENLPDRAGGKPDETSFGPIAVQLRRGAEVLGYDPENLTDQQRNVVKSALQDPKQNAFIAAGFLAQIKEETGYANVPADQLTEAQMQEIAARYNGGPYWESKKAQDYGDDFRSNLGNVKKAMQ